MNIFVDTNIEGSGGMGTVSREFFTKSLGRLFAVNMVNNMTSSDYRRNDSLFFKYGWRQDVYQDFSSGDVLGSILRENINRNIFVMPFDACMLNPKKIDDINLSFVQVWCDSNFTLNQAEKAGIDKSRLRLFRLGMCNPGILKMNTKNQTTFKFINISGPEMFRVKGVDILIKSFLEVFGGRKDVELCIKTSNKNNYDIFLRNYVRSEQQRLGLHFPNIIIKGGVIKHDDIYKFLTNFDCYVHTSRVETFGLPVLEAMSVGLPIISSRYGGVLDFLNDHNSVLVDGTIKKMEKKEWRNNHEALWYETDIEALKESMLYVFNQRMKHLEIAMENAEKIQEAWTWKNSLKFNMQHIKEII